MKTQKCRFLANLMPCKVIRACANTYIYIIKSLRSQLVPVLILSVLAWPSNARGDIISEKVFLE